MTLSGLLILFLTLALFGFIVWLIVTYIPMPAPIKNVIIVIAVVLLILYLINMLGGMPLLNRPLR